MAHPRRWFVRAAAGGRILETLAASEGRNAIACSLGWSSGVCSSGSSPPAPLVPASRRREVRCKRPRLQR